MRISAHRIAILALLTLASGSLATASADEEFTLLTLAGPCRDEPTTRDGRGRLASFREIADIAASPLGGWVVSDSQDHTLRRIAPDGEVSTVAGLSAASGARDGLGAAARFRSPRGIAFTASGDILVADSANHAVRRIDAGGVVTTVAGVLGAAGTADGPPGIARFDNPLAVAEYPDGRILVAELHRLRVIALDGSVSTLAGNALLTQPRDGDGVLAGFGQIQAVVIDTAGTAFVAEATMVREITLQGSVTTLAGSNVPGERDGTRSSALLAPRDLVFGAENILTFAQGHVLREVTSAGDVRTIVRGAMADRRDGILGHAAFQARHLSISDLGVALIDGPVVRLLAGGSVRTLSGCTGRPHPAPEAPPELAAPLSVAVDEAGNVYTCDYGTATVARIAADGTVHRVAGKTREPGYADGPATEARFGFYRSPWGCGFSSRGGVARGPEGVLYVSDPVNCAIRSIARDGSVTTLAGRPDDCRIVDGPATDARLQAPFELLAESDGSLYFLDGDTALRVRRPTGEIETLANDLHLTLGCYSGGLSDASMAKLGERVAVVARAVLSIRQLQPEGGTRVLAGNDRPGPQRDGLGTGARLEWVAGIAPRGSELVLLDLNALRRISADGAVATMWRMRDFGYRDGGREEAALGFVLGFAPLPRGGIAFAESFHGAVRLILERLPDEARIDATTGPVGAARQLDAQPLTASSWQWRMVRRPAGSRAQLSATDIPNPTFVPDVGDLYVFELIARTAAGASISRVAFRGAAPAAELSVRLETSRTVAAQGETVTIDVVVTNAGSIPGGARLFMNFPPGVWTPGPVGCGSPWSDGNETVWHCTVSPLQPGESAVRRMTTNVSVGWRGLVMASLEAPSEIDTNVHDDFASVSLILQDQPPQAVFGISPANPNPGTVLSFLDVSSGFPHAWHWDFGDGATSTERHPTHAYALAGTYEVRLTVTSLLGTHFTRRSLLVGAETPWRAVSIVPGIARTGGVGGTQFRSALWVTNATPRGTRVRLTYRPEDHLHSLGSNSHPQWQPSIERTLASGESLAFDDLVAEAFDGRNDTSGTITVEVPEGLPVPAVAARTYNHANAAGTYGQYIQAIRLGPFPPVESDLTLVGLGGDASTRTNFGVVNCGETGIESHSTLFDASGASRGNPLSLSVAPLSVWQVNRVNEAADAGTLPVFGIRARSGASGLFAYASRLDAATSDPIFVPGNLPARAEQWLDGVAAAPGDRGATFRSELVLAASSATAVELAFVPRGAGVPAATVSVDLAATQTRVYRDVLGELFGIANAAGYLRLRSAEPVVAWARTYSDLGAAGSYGQFVPSFGSGDLLGTAGVVLSGVSENTRFRSNFGAVNVSASVVRLDVEVWDRSGTRRGGREYTLAPGQALFEHKVLQALGLAPLDHAYLRVYPSAAGAVYAWVSLVDNGSNDPSFVRPQTIGP